MARLCLRYGIAAGVLIAASAAQAADIPVKAIAPVVAVYNWTGIYGGIHGGYGRGMKDWLNSTFDYPVSGFLGGGQIGINQQIGNWVIGIEADASWTNINGSQAVAFGGPIIGFVQSITGSTKIDALATVAGRLGFAQDRWLVYVKGGAAWARETHDFAFSTSIAVPGAAPVTQTAIASGRGSPLGYVVGFGAEYAFWGNWSFKSEYNFMNFGTTRTQIAGTQTALGVTTAFTDELEIQQSVHVAKFGLNYRFGPDAPPAIAPARPAPGYNWTGAWIGVQGGYGFGRKDWPDLAPEGEFNVSGWHAGVTTGTSVQAGMFVVGAETEWMWTGIRGGRSDTQNFFGITQTNDIATKIDWLSLNSIRVGFVAADRWQFYFKGGIALASEKHDIGIAQVSPGVGSITTVLSGSALHTGYLAGVGVEHAFLGNWSAKVEYNYVTLPLQNVLTTGAANANIQPNLVGGFATFQRVGISENLHLIKFGINYHFNSLMDVVSAKY